MGGLIYSDESLNKTREIQSRRQSHGKELLVTFTVETGPQPIASKKMRTPIPQLQEAEFCQVCHSSLRENSKLQKEIYAAQPTP